MSLVYLVADSRVAPFDRLKEKVERVLPFADVDRFQFRCSAYELTAWIDRHGTSPNCHWHESEEGVACFSGYGLDRTGRFMTAQDLTDSGDIAQASHRFHGEWTAVIARRNGHLTAGSASSGGGQLYRSIQGPFLLSNRARILWTALRVLGLRPTPDWDALSWLLTLGWVPEVRRTAVAGIELVPSFEVITVEEPGGAPTRRTASKPNFLPGEAQSEPSWDQLVDPLLTNLSWARNAARGIEVGLTGGKDSRLVAAAIHRSDLTDDVRFYTTGPSGHADVKTAQAVAQALGADTEVRVFPPVGDLHNALRRHVAFTEGLMSAWDLKADTAAGGSIQIHGFFGEVYRRQSASVARHPAEFAREVLRGQQDILGLCHHDRCRWQEGRLEGWLEERVSCGLPLAFANDAYYLELRYPRWVAQARQRDALRGSQINPLLHPDLIGAYYALPIEDRRLERLHYELMIRLCPALVELPFAHRSWMPGLAARVDRSASDLVQRPLEHTDPLVGIGWQLPTLRSGWSWVRSFLLDHVRELEALVERRDLEAQLDLAELPLFGRLTWRSARRGLMRPKTLRALRGRPRSAVIVTLTLLTICALLEELDDDLPLRVTLT